jgi:hypothetical protein
MGDLEDVAEWVAHHGAPVSVGSVERLLHWESPSVERSAICGIRIINIDIQEGREELSFVGRRDHHNRVSYLDLGRATWLHRTRRSEHGSEKVHLRCHIVHDDSRRYRVETLTGTFCGHARLSHRLGELGHTLSQGRLGPVS